MTISEETLPSIPLFQGLSAEQKDRLSSLAIHRTVQRGQQIFFEGDKADGFYILLSGRIKIFKLSPEGKEQILHLMAPGDPFGEVPMFADGYFPANALAMEDAEILFYSREKLTEMIGQYPALAMNMLASLSQRLIHLTRLVENLSLREVHERLAAYLLHLSKTQNYPEELHLDINKGQLASLLGTIPETLSRMLTRLHNDGLIEVTGRKIKILNGPGLQQLMDRTGNNP